MAVVSADSAPAGATPSLEVARELARDHNLIPLQESVIGDLETPGAALQTIRGVRERLAGPVPRRARPAGEGHVAPSFESNMTREHFEAVVARIIEYIRAGDAYQVVPSQRWSAPVGVEAFSIYRGLRAVNPSPYIYYLDFGDFE